MPDRRAVLAGAGMVSLTAVTGCLGLLTDDEIAFDASPARVSDATLDDTGYHLDAQDDVVVEETFSAGGQSRDVVVTNKMTEYQKSVDMGLLGTQEAAVFTCLTTPQVNVLNREFNPVSDMSTREIAEMVQDQYEDMQIGDHVAESTVTIYGTSTTQDKYVAEGMLAGDFVDLYLHISDPVEMEDDFLFTVGAYPELGPDEESNILQMMESVEPDA